MSERTIAAEPPPHHEETHHQLCHVCGRKAHDRLVPFHELHPDLKSIVEANALAMERLLHVCPHCVELFSRAKNQLTAMPRFSNRTVTFADAAARKPTQFTGREDIAFLDSGFSHADLTEPKNRIVGYHNIFDPNVDLASLETAEVASWHGMMTSVVAAGNGYLPDGFIAALHRMRK
jgi:serine protease AprX